jgi:hypothetical protein
VVTKEGALDRRAVMTHPDSHHQADSRVQRVEVRAADPEGGDPPCCAERELTEYLRARRAAPRLHGALVVHRLASSPPELTSPVALGDGWPGVPWPAEPPSRRRMARSIAYGVLPTAQPDPDDAADRGRTTGTSAGTHTRRRSEPNGTAIGTLCGGWTRRIVRQVQVVFGRCAHVRAGAVVAL